MNNQKHLFQLPEDITYLNCAYMSPLLQSVEEVGVAAMQRKRNPTAITPNDFFADGDKLRNYVAQLVNVPAMQVAIIPSASYGLAAAVNNLPTNNGSKAITVGNEFPSGYNSLKSWCDRQGKNLQVIAAPDNTATKGEQWNQTLLNSIDADTAVVLLSSVHWTDGTRFDLAAIGQKCKANDAVFIVDGTQSVGAIPLDAQACGIDALVCAGYKWLMGPYSTGFAYYGERFNKGIPLEETWLNRSNAQDFAGLTNYVDDYLPGAARYNSGEYGNFILLPMLNAALKQVLAWGPANIENYCADLMQPLVAFLREKGFGVEEDAYRSKHLMGIGLPPHISLTDITTMLKENKVYVSVRGQSLRISVHLYNSATDIEKLIQVLAQV